MLAALLAATALTACGQKPAAPAGMPAPQVSVAAPLKQNVTDWDEFVGRFEASQHVDVRARAGDFRKRCGRPILKATSPSFG